MRFTACTKTHRPVTNSLNASYDNKQCGGRQTLFLLPFYCKLRNYKSCKWGVVVVENYLKSGEVAKNKKKWGEKSCRFGCKEHFKTEQKTEVT